MSALRTIAIIGAGFSGAATAVNLLRMGGAQPLRVVLINRSGAMARGLAYGTSSRDHVLNVPAGNMSALADDPDDFLRYCRWADPATTPASFVPRRLYGSYLEALLDAAEHAAAESVTLERWAGEVSAIEVAPAGQSAAVRLEDGRELQADRVVLAFGHFAPGKPAIRQPAFYADRHYVGDPWSAAALQRIDPTEPVLLIGSGLTAVDVALSLARQRHAGPIWLMSRRGLLPKAHREQRAVLPPREAQRLFDAMGSTARSQLRALRRAVLEHEARGHDWRDVVAALRPFTPRLWARLPTRERQRFVRRLQPFWDVLRHRCAPEVHARFMALIESGQVRLLAGRLRDCTVTEGGVELAWAPRGSALEQTLRVGAVINCSGPDTDLGRAANPLIRQLLERGLMDADELRIGVKVDADGALIARDGAASPVLRYVGPLLRARDWEATAVPELRLHARAMAERLLEELAEAAQAPP